MKMPAVNDLMKMLSDNMEKQEAISDFNERVRERAGISSAEEYTQEVKELLEKYPYQVTYLLNLLGEYKDALSQVANNYECYLTTVPESVKELGLKAGAEMLKVQIAGMELRFENGKIPVTPIEIQVKDA